ncbi:MAG: hypothetical protein GXP25_05885 [Planctomycetes bacterium]|nr:hypothetical protein [Planctomycetota bacterium]
MSVQTVTIPRFRSALPRVFTDICWDPQKQCFFLVNDEAMCELFMRGNQIDQKKSFISGTGKFSLRGWALVGGKSCVIDLSSMTIQLSVSRRRTEDFPLTTGGKAPSALVWDGATLWSADADTNTIYRHGSRDEEFKVTASFPAAGRAVCGLAWDGQALWSCDAGRVFAYDRNMNVRATYPLPVRISGIAWRDQALWACGKDQAAVYRMGLGRGN